MIGPRRIGVVLWLPLALALLAAAPFASATFPGPNGRIAFFDLASTQLYGVNPDGSGLAQLTDTGGKREAINPSWSADGRHILFTKVRNGDSGFRNSRIWRMRADGSHEQQVADDAEGFNDFQPKYTPDARRIIFTRCRPSDDSCGIWKMRADGTRKEALTPYREENGLDEFPSVSPDGNRIAFTRFFADGVVARIFVMRDNGSNPHPISPRRLKAGTPDWSPDGERIAFFTHFFTGSRVLTMRPNGTDIQRVTPDRFPFNDAEPSYSPSGDALVFTSDRNYPDFCCNDLFVIDPSGSDEQMVSGGLSGITLPLGPVWGTAPALP
jgi:Tol biopolymer transport system component